MKPGFTLLEFLLAAIIIAFLLITVVLQRNLVNTLQIARDSERRTEIQELSHAIYQYSIEEGGYAGVTSQPTEVCVDHVDQDQCEAQGLLFLGDLVPQYLSAIPQDPLFKGKEESRSGYEVYLTNTNRISMRALESEQSEIELIR